MSAWGPLKYSDVSPKHRFQEANLRGRRKWGGIIYVPISYVGRSLITDLSFINRGKRENTIN